LNPVTQYLQAPQFGGLIVLNDPEIRGGYAIASDIERNWKSQIHSWFEHGDLTEVGNRSTRIVPNHNDGKSAIES
jgi:hypothetical protein